MVEVYGSSDWRKSKPVPYARHKYNSRSSAISVWESVDKLLAENNEGPIAQLVSVADSKSVGLGSNPSRVAKKRIIKS